MPLEKIKTYYYIQLKLSHNKSLNSNYFYYYSF